MGGLTEFPAGVVAWVMWDGLLCVWGVIGGEFGCVPVHMLAALVGGKNGAVVTRRPNIRLLD